MPGQGAQRGSPCQVMKALVWSAVSLAAGMENCGLEPAPGPPPEGTTAQAENKQTKRHMLRDTHTCLVKSERNITELLYQAWVWGLHEAHSSF